MKLLEIEMSSLTALFKASNPEKQLYLPRVANELVERYSFVEGPKSFSDLSGNHIDFRHGLFDESAIETLELYNDGVLISARADTSVIDAFLDDLLGWMQDDLGLAIRQTRKVDRMYLSNIVVSAEEYVMSPLEPLLSACAKLNSLVEQNAGLDASFRPSGFMLSVDQTQIPSLRPAPFKLERKFTSEFSKGEFFSSAPLKTDQHMALLKALEETL